MRHATIQMDILQLALQLSCEAGELDLARRWLIGIEARTPSPASLTLARLRVALAAGTGPAMLADVPILLAKGQEQEALAVAYAVLQAAGEPEKAAAVLRGREKTAAPDLLRAAGRHFLGIGNAADALPLLRRALQHAPEDTDIRALLVEAELTIGQIKAARRSIRPAAARVPASRETQERLIEQLRRIGDPAGAERLARRYARLRDLHARLIAGLDSIELADPNTSIRDLLARLRAAG